MVPDLSTLRIASWLEKTAYVTCNAVDMKSKDLVKIAPRSILINQVKNFQKKNLIAIGASELEYYMYKNSYENAHEKNYNDLDSFGYFIGDYNMLQSTREEKLNSLIRKELKKSGVPVENSKGEYGYGQHELNIKYADVLTMSDRHVVYKQCFKEVSQKIGVSVTFMAKPHSQQSGSSCHLHVNLSDPDGNNLFAGTEDLAGIKCSKLFQHFLGGWIHHTPELMCFYAPTINSYKRFASSSWAPTRLGWSFDNRSAGFRIVGEGKNLRIECRIPGADTNAYLAFSAALASGMDGILNKILPTQEASGNLYINSKTIPLPSNLQEATLRFNQSVFAREVFGSEVIDHYSHYFQNECDSYEKAVTDWEKSRYFEQI